MHDYSADINTCVSCQYRHACVNVCMCFKHTYILPVMHDYSEMFLMCFGVFYNV